MSRTKQDLINDIAALLNKANRESCSNTPDYILAEYMVNSLEELELAIRARDTHEGREIKTIIADAP